MGDGTFRATPQPTVSFMRGLSGPIAGRAHYWNGVFGRYGPGAFVPRRPQPLRWTALTCGGSARAAVGLYPGVQITTGSHAGVDIDKDGRLRSRGNRHLEREVMDQPVGMASVGSAGQQVSLDPKLLKSGDLFLIGPQLRQLQMIRHQIRRFGVGPNFGRRSRVPNHSFSDSKATPDATVAP